MAKVKKKTKATKKLSGTKLTAGGRKQRLKPAVLPGGATPMFIGAGLLFLIVFFSLLLPKNQFQLAKEQLIKNPGDFEAHLTLAEEYLANNQIKKAEKELLLVQKNSENRKTVLGKQTSAKIDRLWQKKRESDPKDIRKLIGKWEAIVFEKPDYRDGYLQLALLHYKLYENQKARENLKKALELDPNFEPVKKMKKEIEKTQ
jgi:Tfp pilus assembly protein PilF